MSIGASNEADGDPVARTGAGSRRSNLVDGAIVAGHPGAGAARLESVMRYLSRSIVSVAVISALAFLIACGANDGTGGLNGETEVLEVVVGPERVECVGIALMECLMVDGEFFYDEIEGFEHQEGYEYRLRIEQYDAWPDMEEPPQDAGRYGYRLIEIISKTKK